MKLLEFVWTRVRLPYPPQLGGSSRYTWGHSCYGKVDEPATTGISRGRLINDRFPGKPNWQ